MQNGMIILLPFVLLWFSTPVQGSFGDIYCGEDNCYSLLNVDRDAERNTIRRSYRNLARIHHPDQHPDVDKKKEAEIVMRKLNVAYEILMDEEQRRDYNEMLDSPDQMYFHYYQYYRRRYTPKVDVRLVILAILIICSVVQYIGHWTSYDQALTYLTKDPKHRSKAREIANAEGLFSVRRRENGDRYSREELKEREEVVLRTVIMRTVDLRGDCSKPCISRVLLFRLIILPYTCVQWLHWMGSWIWRYWVRRMPYDADAQVFLTRRKLGFSQAQWEGMDEEKRCLFLNKALWDKARYEEYTKAKAEEMRVMAAENSQQKRYRRYVKRAGGPPQLGMDDVDY